jgi:predicted TIM-barrel fold metal-dependent hydrolase
MDKLSDKFIFGTDFPGVPGVKKNILSIKSLNISKDSQEKIFFKNAMKIFKFWNF